MLSPADSAIVARDPTLPGLALALDAEALATRLARPPLAPAYLRYKPGTSCVVAFLTGWGEDGQSPFAAIAYNRGRFEMEQRRAGWLSGPEPALFLSDVSLIIAPMAHDRELKALRRLGTPARQAKYLRQVMGPHTRSRDTFTILRYKPGRRLVGRLDRHGRARAVVKSYSASEFTAALVGAATAAAFGGAPLLGVNTGLRTLATGWIKGDPLCPAQSGYLREKDLRRTGKVLARLHAAANIPPTRLDRSDEIAELHATAATLDWLCPELAEKAAPLIHAVAERLRRAPCVPRLIHGDFSADQVILHRGKPVIIDWDCAAAGDQSRDVGTFLARLDAQCIDGIIAPAEAEAARALFVDAYRTTADVAPETVQAQHARALLALATEGFRRRLPDWPVHTERLLSRVDALLAESAPRRVAPLDPAMPVLAAALDAGAMQPRLAAMLGVAPSALALSTPRLMRHKRGRRALVRYPMTLQRNGLPVPVDLLGRIRVGKADRRALDIHVALRAAGFDGRPPHGIGIPRSFGCIDDLQLWLQEVVPGETVTSFLKPGRNTEVLARVGAALARLHGVSIESFREPWTMVREIEVLDRALMTASTRLPNCSKRIETIRERATALALSLQPAPSKGIHRDFYPDQVLIDGDKVWLLDLDLYALGDPAIDVGNFLAHVAELALRHYGDPDALAEHEAAFLASYNSGATIDLGRVAALRTLSLARHIHISMQFEDRSHTTLPLIEISEEALAPGSGLVRTFESTQTPRFSHSG